MQKDGVVRVKETIQYDFEGVERHGIIRHIPLQYHSGGGMFRLSLSDVSVTNEKGERELVEQTKERGSIFLKIGNPNETIRGKKTYILSYTIDRAISFLEQHDELYWNAIPDAWSVPITTAIVRVHTPDGIASNVQTDCYTGTRGSTERCVQTQGKGMYVFRTGQLSPYEGMTIVVALPKGVLTPPSRWASLLALLKDNWVAGVPLLIPSIFGVLWFIRGRDPEGRGTIIPEYDVPDGLMPGELGTIVDEKAGGNELVAELIYLAKEGYLRITREEKKGWLTKNVDYTLEKVKEPDDRLLQYQKMIMNALFKPRFDVSVTSIVSLFKGAQPSSEPRKKIALSELQDQFYREYKEITTAMDNAVATKGYFVKSPMRVRGMYMGIVAILFIPFFFLVDYVTVYVIVVAGVSALVSLLFAYLMPSRTAHGVRVREHIEGLKLYLTVAEKDRLAFHHAPEKNPTQFEHFLPYAVALGIEKKWAKQFEGMTIPQPAWYNDASGGVFTAAVFADSLDDFRSVSTETLAATPHRSGGSGLGGGSVGGGLGGGGGRSW